MHLARTGVANIRRLWCPGNISRAERSFGGRRSMAGGRNVAAACGVNQRFTQSAEEVANVANEDVVCPPRMPGARVRCHGGGGERADLGLLARYPPRPRLLASI